MQPTVKVYIDGFNLYKRMIEGHRELKWLDIPRLANLLCPNENVIQINYFTAQVDPDNPGSRKRERQRIYWSALRQTHRVRLKTGRFVRREFDCRVDYCEHRGKTYSKYVEKLTDVKIACHLVADSLVNPPAKVLVISGDTDLIPAYELIQSRAKPKPRISVLIPEREIPTGQKAERRRDEFRNYGDVKFLPTHLLAQCQFPVVVSDQIVRPSAWGPA